MAAHTTIGPRADGCFDTFISYSRRDANFARSAAELLMANGLRVWFDEYQVAKMMEPDPKERVAQIPALLADGVARSCSAILITNQHFANSLHCVKTEAATLLGRNPSIPVLNLGLPAEDDTTARLTEVLPPHLPPPENVSNLGECLPLLERFFGRRLRATLACESRTFKVAKEPVIWMIGPTKFFLDDIGWEFRRPAAPGHPEDRSGPSVMKCFGSCEIDINVVCGKTGFRRAELEKRFTEETGDSRWRGYEMAIGLAQSSFKGYSRFTPGIKKAIGGFSTAQKLKAYARQLSFTVVRWLLGREAYGIHLFHHQGLDQFAITYWSRALGWTRKYCVHIADPAGGSDYEFIFTGGCKGADWQEFLSHAAIMDQYVGSLRTECGH
jgi:hypothetical protein